MFIAHPLAPSRDLKTDNTQDAVPMVSQGRVVALAPTLEIALADYHAGGHVAGHLLDSVLVGGAPHT